MLQGPLQTFCAISKSTSLECLAEPFSPRYQDSTFGTTAGPAQHLPRFTYSLLYHLIKGKTVKHPTQGSKDHNYIRYRCVFDGKTVHDGLACGTATQRFLWHIKPPFPLALVHKADKHKPSHPACVQIDIHKLAEKTGVQCCPVVSRLTTCCSLVSVTLPAATKDNIEDPSGSRQPLHQKAQMLCNQLPPPHT